MSVVARIRRSLGHGVLAAVVAVALSVPFPAFLPQLVTMAHADDNDGGDDGDDGGGDDAGDDDDDDDDDDRAARPDRGNPGRGPAARRAPRRAEPPPTVARAPAPQRAADEIVVTDIAAGDLAILVAEGFVVIEAAVLGRVAASLHRLRKPSGLPIEAALDRVRALPTGVAADFNHFYRAGQGVTAVAAPAAPAACRHLNCAALALIDWPAARAGAPNCQVTVPIGIIDTGINVEHDNLRGARIELIRLDDDGVDPSLAIHGTAVASLLVGRADGRAPGLVPEARVIAVDVFGREGMDERASVVSVLKAIDLMATRSVRVVNMSLAGPPNLVLEQSLATLTAPGGAIVLAAAGNAGPLAPAAYPAAYDTVVAVTAVDARGLVYRGAQRGPHLDIAAPGVDVWSATSVSGVKSRSGTSFAVPFATAAAAILASRDATLTPAGVATRLRAMVRDAGAAGFDDIYGGGVLSMRDLCAAGLQVE